MPPPQTSRRFSLFGFGESSTQQQPPPRSSIDKIRVSNRDELSPILKIETDKNVYRPGDEVIITIEIQTPSHPIISNSNSTFETSLLVERLSFELKGVEKLDTQWFSTQKPIPGFKQRRGENVFLDCSTTSLVSNQIITSGGSKKCELISIIVPPHYRIQICCVGEKWRLKDNHIHLSFWLVNTGSRSLIRSPYVIYHLHFAHQQVVFADVVRTVLPSSIPPSYRGTTIRYFYYVRTALSGQWLILESGHSNRDLVKNITGLEARVPLQIWVTQQGNGLVNEESQPDGRLRTQCCFGI
ncbi:hypothetical protein KSS87_007308 [Heliosperma pusillum]|nr:hypothetical protein KSS87_007308 [Heliosperma pusillum]